MFFYLLMKTHPTLNLNAKNPYACGVGRFSTVFLTNFDILIILQFFFAKYRLLFLRSHFKETMPTTLKNSNDSWLKIKFWFIFIFAITQQKLGFSLCWQRLRFKRRFIWDPLFRYNLKRRESATPAFDEELLRIRTLPPRHLRPLHDLPAWRCHLGPLNSATLEHPV